MARGGRQSSSEAESSSGSLLLAAAVRLAETPGPGELSDALAKIAIDLTSADGGLAAVSRGSRLVTHRRFQNGEALFFGYSLPAAQATGVCGPDGFLPPSLLPEDLLSGLPGSSFLGTAVPGLEGEPAGLVYVHKAGGSFSQYDREMLARLAVIASPALQNACVRERLREAEQSVKRLRARVEETFERQQELTEFLDRYQELGPAGGRRMGTADADRELVDYLRRSREQLATILEGVAEGVIVHDSDGRLVHVNDAAVNVLGFASQADLLGLTASDIFSRVQFLREGMTVPVADLPGQWAADGLARTETTVRMRNRQGGEERDLSVRSTPVIDEDGRLRFNVTIFTDITDRLRMERMREQFLSMVTHELRSPAAVIKLGIALAREGEQTDEAALEVLADIEAQADRLMTLVDNLLDMAQVEAGSFSVTPDLVALSSAIDEAFARLPKPLTSRIRTGPRPEMPLLLIDLQRTAQVLVNLLNNAGKFSTPGTPIDLSVECDGGEVSVHVTNEGPAIPEEHMPLLFHKFYRAGRQGGTGLGLAISRHVVEKQGGRIWAVSSPERRVTTFSFSLPIPAGQNAAALATSLPPAGATKPLPPEGKG